MRSLRIIAGRRPLFVGPRPWKCRRGSTIIFRCRKMSWEKSLIGALKVEWEIVGKLSLGSDDKIKFPKAPSKGGLYQFHVKRKNGVLSRYVGETENLNRRFAHYRNPGPTQLTNLRINALFRELLSHEEAITLAIVTERAWILRNDKEEAADFTEKSMRRLFENFVLVMGKAGEMEELNR